MGGVAFAPNLVNLLCQLRLFVVQLLIKGAIELQRDSED